MVALGRLEKTMFTLVTLCVGSIAFGTTRANESTGISRVAIVAGIADTVGLLDRSSRGLLCAKELVVAGHGAHAGEPTMVL